MTDNKVTGKIKAITLGAKDEIVLKVVIDSSFDETFNLGFCEICQKKVSHNQSNLGE